MNKEALMADVLEEWKYEYFVNQIHRTAYKKHENFIIGSLIHDTNLSELKPCLQHYAKRKDGKYALIDLYYPQIELAVEIDEEHHLKNSEGDKFRQLEIEENLNCSFFRIKIIEGNILCQINDLKTLIHEKMSKYRSSGKWIDWQEPKRINISEAKELFKETLFIKIKGRIDPDKLYDRQTGHWRIGKKKQEKIKKVIIVHDTFVSRIFQNIRWYDCETDGTKVGYAGDEIVDDVLIDSIIEGWNWQQTITYSNDLYKK